MALGTNVNSHVLRSCVFLRLVTVKSGKRAKLGISRGRVCDALQAFLQVKLRELVHGSVGAFDVVAETADSNGGYLETLSSRLCGVPHDLFCHVLAPRPMALFALNSVLDVERGILLPVFRLGGCSMTTEAYHRLPRFAWNPTELGDFLGLWGGENGIGLGVLGQQPAAVLMPHSFASMAFPTHPRPHIDWVALILLCSSRMGDQNGEKQESGGDSTTHGIGTFTSESLNSRAERQWVVVYSNVCMN
jgi:hypothetical protein